MINCRKNSLDWLNRRDTYNDYLIEYSDDTVQNNALLSISLLKVLFLTIIDNLYKMAPNLLQHADQVVIDRLPA